MAKRPSLSETEKRQAYKTVGLSYDQDRESLASQLLACAEDLFNQTEYKKYQAALALKIIDLLVYRLSRSERLESLKNLVGSGQIPDVATVIRGNFFSIGRASYLFDTYRYNGDCPEKTAQQRVAHLLQQPITCSADVIENGIRCIKEVGIKTAIYLKGAGLIFEAMCFSKPGIDPKDAAREILTHKGIPPNFIAALEKDPTVQKAVRVLLDLTP